MLAAFDEATAPTSKGGVFMRTVLLRVTLAITASAALVVTAFTAPAGAKVPGPNGQIVFGRFDQALGDFVSFTVNPDGSHEQQLFPGHPRCPAGRRMAPRWRSSPPVPTARRTVR
jgi:hypothetical protein